MSEAKMRNVWGRRASKMLLLVFLVPLGLSVFSVVVMWLWNWLVPPVFGWHTINFWQALGIFVLSKILFGGFRGGHRMHGSRRMKERWEQMPPEEREKFRKGMQGFCGRSRSEPDVPQQGQVQA